jgi:hypothetical protein
MPFPALRAFVEELLAVRGPGLSLAVTDRGHILAAGSVGSADLADLPTTSSSWAPSARRRDLLLLVYPSGAEEP